MAIDEPSDFQAYGCVDQGVKVHRGVFQGEGVGVGKVRKDEGVNFCGEGGKGGLLCRRGAIG